MKLNWAERWVVNNPIRVIEQRMEIHFLKGMVPLKEGMKILEVGCGRGAGARLIHKTFRPSSLYAMDLDIDMVRKAKGYLSPEEREIILLHVGDVFRLPFRDGELDVVFGFGVLHHVLDWRGAAGEIARVAMEIAANLCVYTNAQISVVSLAAGKPAVEHGTP